MSRPESLDPQKRSEKEVLIESLHDQIEDKLQGEAGNTPNNYRVRPFTLDYEVVRKQGWFAHPQGIQRAVPNFYRGVPVQRLARLIVGAVDPWKDRANDYIGCEFVQVRLKPRNVKGGAIVYSLVLDSDGNNPRYFAYEEIPYLSAVPNYNMFLPQRYNSSYTATIDILNSYSEFLQAAQPLQQ